MTSHIREIRFLARHEGRLLRICKLAFARSDASLYLMPYAPTGRYFYGSRAMPEGQIQETFDFTEQLSSERVPKVSIHESGRVHVEAGPATLAGPLQIPPLATLRGEHIATVSVDRFDSLADFEGSPRGTGAEVARVIDVDPGVSSGRLSVYINGVDDSFRPKGTIITCTRATLVRPLRFLVSPISQAPLGEDLPRGGITVLAGWDSTRVADAPWDYLYVRGL